MRLHLAAGAAIVLAMTGGSVTQASAAADPCGGTGGNGRIVSVGSRGFTLESGDGRMQAVHLVRKATVRDAAGIAATSELRLGSG